MKTTFTLTSLLVLCLFVGGCGKVSQMPIETNLSGWSFYSEEADAKRSETWGIKEGVLKCSGKPLGYLYTNDSYRDFILTLEWRWPDEKLAGKGGVLIDAVGADKIWPKSLEAQINANSAGDFWALDGYKIAIISEQTKTLTHEKFGELINISKRFPTEKQPGQWNSYKIIAEGPIVTLIINDQVVNKASRMNTSGGKICITSEGTGIEFRNIVLVSRKL